MHEHSQYTFNTDQLNYINAIAKYNVDLKITLINGKPPFMPMTCKDLPSYIEKLNDVSITIDCEGNYPCSTTGVFPIVTEEMLLSAIEMPPHEMTKASHNLHKINEYISFVMSDSKSDSFAPLELQSTDKKQCFYILNSIRKDFDLLGAIHLSDSNVIFIQLKDESNRTHNFVLSYANHKFENVNNVYGLDMDQGFVNSDFSIKSNDILDPLNKFFIEWKNNNYNGVLIPTDSAGFSCTEESKETISFAQSSLILLAGKKELEKVDELDKAKALLPSFIHPSSP